MVTSQNAAMPLPLTRTFFLKPAVGVRGEWLLPTP